MSRYVSGDCKQNGACSRACAATGLVRRKSVFILRPVPDGSENENALSPNFVQRRGISYRLLSIDRRRRVGLLEAGSTVSARYAGDLPLCTECIHKLSFYCIRQRMCSHCSWIRLGVMWSEVLRPKISRAAAFWTCCSGRIVVSRRDANTEL